MATKKRMSARLELRYQGSGPRHHLDGEPIHAGRTLELVMPGGAGLFGHYEWTYRKEDKPILGIALGPVTPSTNPDESANFPHGELVLPVDAEFYVECAHGSHWPERCRTCDTLRNRELDGK